MLMYILNFNVSVYLSLFGFLFPLCSLQANAWTSPTNLSELGKNASSPQIAIDPLGNATAVWCRFDGTHLVIQSSTKPVGKNWSNIPETLSSPKNDALHPCLCIDHKGNTTVAWESIIGEHSVIQAVTRPYRGTWSKDPATLSLPEKNCTLPQVAADSQGNITAVWQCREDQEAIIQATTSTSKGIWQHIPNQLSLSGHQSINPQLVSDYEGNTTVVWQCSKGEFSEIHAACRLAQGDWPTIPDILSSSDQKVSYPQIAVDSFGDLTVVWNQFDGKRGMIHATTKPLGGNWQLNSDCISNPLLNALPPHIALDSMGSATVVWESFCDNRNSHVCATTKLYGRSWQSSPDLLSFTGNRNSDPHVTIDAEGNAAVIWNSMDRFFTYIHCLVKPSNTHWQFPSHILSWSMRRALMPQIFASPYGEVIAIWVMQENSSFIQARSILELN